MLSTIEQKQSNTTISMASISTMVPSAVLLSKINYEMIFPGIQNTGSLVHRLLALYQDSLQYKNIPVNQNNFIPNRFEEEPIVELKSIGSIRIKIGKVEKLGFSGIID